MTEVDIGATSPAWSGTCASTPPRHPDHHLASDDASFVHGAIPAVDGGRTAA
jgi:hypothetical protein